MELNVAPVRDFLWESYGVYLNTEFLQSVQDCSQSTKNNLFIDHALNNIFLFRVKRDPGFSLFVRDKVLADPLLQEKVRHLVLFLFGETAKLSYSDDDAPGPKGVIEIMMQAMDEGKNPFEESIQFYQDYVLQQKYAEERIARERKSKLKYLQARLEVAAERIDNDLEILTIRQQMFDYGTGKYFGHLMSADDPLFPAAGFTEDTFHLANSFVFSHFKFRRQFYGADNYNISDLPLHTCVIWMLPYEINLETAIFGKNVLDDPKDWKTATELWKFEADLTTIAAQEWFLTLSEDEKLSVLNDDYPFEMRDDLLQEMAKFDSDSFDQLQLKGIQLFYAGHFEHAANLLEFVFKKQETKKNKYTTASGIATYYREYGDYENALKWYKIALKLTKKLDPANRFYKDFVERKNCAEMGYYLHGSEFFRKEINRILQDSKQFPTKLRSFILYNLVEACRRTGHYHLEYDSLVEYISLIDANDPNFEQAFARLKLFNETSDSDNYQAIREFEIRKKEEVYFNRYRTALATFQYRDAMHWVEQQINLKPENSVYIAKAALFLHEGRNDDAINLCLTVAEAISDPIQKCTYYISAALIKAKDAGSMNTEINDLISTAISSLQESDGPISEQTLNGIIDPLVYETASWSDAHFRGAFFDSFINILIRYRSDAVLVSSE